MRLLFLSAEQGNVEARVKIGDYYYYAVGGIKEPDFKQAAHHYKKATEYRNTQAMFNLGYMHEHGMGLPQDFHLAKRWYDKADSTSPEAHVPVTLALGQLWVHRFYRAIRYGDSVSGFPTFAVPIISWLRNFKLYYFPDEYGATSIENSQKASDESEPEGAPQRGEAESLKEAKEPEGTKIWGADRNDGAALSEIFFTDTWIAIWLSVLLAIVLYYRNYRLRE